MWTAPSSFDTYEWITSWTPFHKGKNFSMILIIIRYANNSKYEKWNIKIQKHPTCHRNVETRINHKTSKTVDILDINYKIADSCHGSRYIMLYFTSRQLWLKYINCASGKFSSRILFLSVLIRMGWLFCCSSILTYFVRFIETKCFLCNLES